jgi:nitrite reductase (cytochrome c-552)
MPYVREGASKYSSHDVHSPLLDPELACGQCHTDSESVVRRVNLIQQQVADTKLAAEDALIDAINALKAAAADPDADQALLDQARALHRVAQFRWDFVSAENSTGFHNPEYALQILAESTNLARQAQMLAAQAADDPALLGTGTYYTVQETAPPFYRTQSPAFTWPLWLVDAASYQAQLNWSGICSSASDSVFRV